MFGGGDDAVLFQSPNISCPKPGVQQHRFAVGLLCAAPPAVPHHVDHWSEYQTHANGPQFESHGLRNRVNQRRIEGGRQPDSLWENGGAAPLGAVEGFAVLQHRKAETIGLHRAAGIFVDSLCRLSGAAPCRRKKAGDIADVARRCVSIGIVLPIHEQEALQLGNFFCGRHLCEQGLGTLIRRQRRVSIIQRHKAFLPT